MNPLSIRALGVDMAFANMGLAFATIDVGNVLTLKAKHIRLVSTGMHAAEKKSVRKSSIELRRATELIAALDEAVREWQPEYIFAEIPSGSQSASAARALGIALGAFASLALTGIPIIEVSPMEVKAVVFANRARTRKMPTKREIIQYAAKHYPDVEWKRAEHTSKGHKLTKGERKGEVVGAYQKGDLAADNEHCADALVTCEAGMLSTGFRTVLPALLRNAPQQKRERRRLGSEWSVSRVRAYKA